jgi:hypothetical protein
MVFVVAVGVAVSVVDVIVRVTPFVAVELTLKIAVVHPVSTLAAMWEVAVIAEAGIVVPVYVAVEVCRTMKPGAGSDEDSTRKPHWSVVAIGSAAVRSVSKVAVGADWRGANLDRDLSLRARRSGEEQSAREDEKRKISESHSMGDLEREFNDACMECCWIVCAVEE